MIVTITDDFALQKIADSGQCFRVRHFVDGTYRFIKNKDILYIRQLSPNLFEADCTNDKWQQVWAPYFDLERSYELIRKQIPDKDFYIKNAAAIGAGLRILHQDPWEMLITFIISQQKTIPSIKTAVEAIAEKYGDLTETSRETLYLFPSATQMQQATAEELNNCRLGYRTPYILDAITKVSSGQLDLDKLYTYDDMQLFDTLKTVRGVGDKVANCIALFAYARTSLVPIDTWIKKVIDNVYDGNNPFVGYGDVGGIIQQYIFYYAQQNKEEVKNS